METLGLAMKSIGRVHMASIFKDEVDQFNSAVPFILGGLERHEKCLYVADAHTSDDIVEALMKVKDVQGALDAHQLVIAPSKEVYLKDRRFDIDRTIGFIRSFEQQALSEGFSGMRGTGEMTWYDSGLPGVEGLREYEARLNNLYPGSAATILCQYDEPSFDSDLLLDAIRAHPKVIVQGELCVNPYFTPPDEFLSSMRGQVPKGIYERASRDILKRARLADIHRLELRDVRKASRRMAIIDGPALDEIQSQASIMSFYTELALDEFRGTDVTGYLEKMARNCANIQHRIDFIRSVQLIGQTEPRWWVLKEVLESIAEKTGSGGPRFEFKVGKVGVMADGLFEIALESVVQNIPGLKGKGDKVVVKSSELRSGLMISIEHHGRGLPEAVKERIFDCGYRYGRSDGFGLFLAREVLSSSGMTLKESGAPGKSTRFEILVPVGRYSTERNDGS